MVTQHFCRYLKERNKDRSTRKSAKKSNVASSPRIVRGALADGTAFKVFPNGQTVTGHFVHGRKVHA